MTGFGKRVFALVIWLIVAIALIPRLILSTGTLLHVLVFSIVLGVTLVLLVLAAIPVDSRPRQ